MPIILYHTDWNYAKWDWMCQLQECDWRVRKTIAKMLESGTSSQSPEGVEQTRYFSVIEHYLDLGIVCLINEDIRQYQ